MKGALVGAYRRLPEPVRYGLRPLNGIEEVASLLPSRLRVGLQNLVQVVRSLTAARRYRARLVRLEGRASVGGAPLRVLTDLAGEGDAYWSALLFEGPSTRAVVGDVRGPLGFTRVAQGDADLILLRHNAFARRRAAALGFVSVPTWVQSYLDTRRPLEAIVEGTRSGRASRKNDIRRTQREGFRSATTRGPAEVRRFFEEWYVPFNRARWGASLVPLSADWVRQYSRFCEVLWVKRGNERVGASLLERQGRTLRGIAFGLRDPAAVRDGVLAAAYYFMIEQAVREGYDTLRLGGSRPVLSDGALRHKLKWGGALGTSWQWDYLAVRARPDSAAAQALLAAHPLVVEMDDRFLAATSDENGRGLYASFGLGGILVPTDTGWAERALGEGAERAA